MIKVSSKSEYFQTGEPLINFSIAKIPTLVEGFPNSIFLQLNPQKPLVPLGFDRATSRIRSFLSSTTPVFT